LRNHYPIIVKRQKSDIWQPAFPKKTGKRPMNFSVAFKTALTMLKKYRYQNPSIKTKCKMGGWLDECLIDMLGIDPS
jgi:GH18 family chitinase